MKIGCSSWSFRDAFARRELDLFSFVELAAALGLDGVEPLTGVFPSVRPRFTDELRSKLAGLPVEISAMAVANDFGWPDPGERRRQCEDIVQWTYVCRDLGVRYLRTFTGRLHPGVEEREARSWVYECYGSVLPAAERTGVTLAVENHGPLLSSADELAAMVMHFGCSSLQLNPDPTNFLPRHHEMDGPRREPIYTSLAKVARFAVHSHLKVRDFDAHGRPTNVDVPRLLAIYRGACYDGFISLEYFGEGSATEAVKKGVAYLRALMED